MMGQLNFMVTVKHSYVNRPRNDSLRVGYISFSIFFFFITGSQETFVTQLTSGAWEAMKQ